MKYIKKCNISLLVFFLVTFHSLWSQSLEHPIIYTTHAERSNLLQTIQTYNWSNSIVTQMHNQVDSILKTHKTNPNKILSSIPAFSGSSKLSENEASPLATAHYKILKTASEAGMLYFITKNEEYAQLSADILAVYIEKIASRTPKTTTICGNQFFDPRTTYPHFALAYDFIYNFLKKENTKVYNVNLKRNILFDNNKAQKALKNMIGNVLQEYGKPDQHYTRVSNHPILTAPGALFLILCIEDDVERERLFQVFWNTGTAHQNSFSKTILPLFSEQGIWPESLSYSFMPNISMVLNIVNRVKPEMEIYETTKQIINGNFLFDNLRYPDRRFVRYGDSKRNNDFTEKNYRHALHFAIRNNENTIKEKAQMALSLAYKAKGDYFPKINSDSPFEQYQHLQLFWGHPIPKNLTNNLAFNKKTVIVKHAGIALQRNYVAENNETYGLCGIIGGAHYVHSHLTGISMELYGAGYVMAPNAGLPKSVSERQIPLHEHYFRLYAGNNTVIVNGNSHGLDKGSWKQKANVWQNKTISIAAEPKHLAEGIAKEFSFATQFLNDTVNHALQERTLSTIRTSATTAYYFDMFRSKSKNKNHFHDYIYHNIGDKTNIFDANKILPLYSTNRYQNDIGDVVKSPGWRFFENTKASLPTENAIKVRFDVNVNQRFMHVFIPAGTKREYTHALAPPTREAKNGYLNKKTQVLAIRKKGEAWNQPFVAVFEPSTNKKASVQKIETLLQDEKVIGVKVISKISNTTITDYIISQDNSNATYENNALGIQFTGRFGIVRISKTDKKINIKLYIGDGQKLNFKDYSLLANQNNSAFKEWE